MGSEEGPEGPAFGRDEVVAPPDAHGDPDVRPSIDAVERPSPRLLRSPADAEVAAAEWTRWLGFPDAAVTGAGADGGVDIRGKSVVGQVKAHMVPIGRPDLQRLYGIAQAERRLALFFSLMSYTEQAIEWAESVGMALFRFNHAGEVEPVNKGARNMFERAELDPVAGSAPHDDDPSSLPPPMPEALWAYPLLCRDELACAILTPPAGRRRRPDRLLWITQGWMLVGGIRFDYTYWAQVPRRVERFGTSRSAFDLRHGALVYVPPLSSDPQQYSDSILTVPPRLTLDGIAAYIRDQWNRLLGPLHLSEQQAAWRDLARLGVPQGIGNLVVHVEGVFMLPFFSAFYTGPTGNYFKAVGGSTGAIDERLGALFTRNAPDLYPYLATGRRIV